MNQLHCRILRLPIQTFLANHVEQQRRRLVGRRAEHARLAKRGAVSPALQRPRRYRHLCATAAATRNWHTDAALAPFPPQASLSASWSSITFDG